MKENKKILKRKETGITLISLVITIIVLLILAGVSIAMLTGENGILTQAKKTKEETEKASEEEALQLEQIENTLNGESFLESKGVNAPVLGENMKLVTYDENSKTWVPDNSNTNYDHIAGEETEDNNKSRWANAVVTIDGVDSYFVWIPRFAYKINYNSTNDGGTIDVKFLKGTSNIAADGTVCKYADDSTLNKETDYIIHPAFTSNVDLGGWRNEITGIWVGKYESSLVDKTNKENITNILTNEEDSGNILLSEAENLNKAIAVQPGMSSWRYCTIGNMYTNAKEYSTALNSHMLKNSEWGAVAYLTHSQYGRNGHEIDVNDNSNYITADEGISANSEQSSTGNVYGIYDLSGGAYEYISTYYNSGELLENGDSFVGEKSTEYTTMYQTSNYKIGDASGETKNWFNDAGYYAYQDFPFWGRGAGYNEDTISGIFCFFGNSGKAVKDSSFRLCLIK